MEPTIAHRVWTRCKRSAAWTAAGLLCASTALAAGWEPTKPITFAVSGGPGGGADQMARLIQSIIAKHNLMKQPMVVVNKGGGAGAEGFLDVKGAKGDPHKIVITLSNLFTTPLATGVPFNWKDLTPVQMMALDEFVLWVNAKSPYHTAQEYIAAVKAKPDTFKMGGAGSKREDQIVTAMLEQATGTKFTFIPYKGGGEISSQLVGGHIDSDVNNPIEHIAHWKAGEVRPLCVMDDQRMPFTQKIADGMSWHDIPTCKEQGIDAQYLMLRAILMPKGVPPDAVAWYVNVLKRVTQTPEWKDFVNRGAYKEDFLTDGAFVKFLEQDEKRHHDIMEAAGFLAK
jgi:putative tricarboxylic transport membrane protein